MGIWVFWWQVVIFGGSQRVWFGWVDRQADRWEDMCWLDRGRLTWEHWVVH